MCEKWKNIAGRDAILMLPVGVSTLSLLNFHRSSHGLQTTISDDMQQQLLHCRDSAIYEQSKTPLLLNMHQDNDIVLYHATVERGDNVTTMKRYISQHDARTGWLSQ